MPRSSGRGPKRRRISRSAEFERVYRQGRSHANRWLVLYAFPRASEADEPRLGLSVSRRVGGAVERSRVKRLIREAFWAEASTLPADADYVVVARPEARLLGEREGMPGVRRALGELIEKHAAGGSAGGGRRRGRREQDAEAVAPAGAAAEGGIHGGAHEAADPGVRLRPAGAASEPANEAKDVDRRAERGSQQALDRAAVPGSDADAERSSRLGGSDPSTADPSPVRADGPPAGDGPGVAPDAPRTRSAGADRA